MEIVDKKNLEDGSFNDSINHERGQNGRRKLESGTYTTIIEQIKKEYQVDYGFAYGSAFFEHEEQKNGSAKLKDLIFVVDNTKDWHENNISKHSSDYSLFSKLGVDAVDRLHKYGSKALFFTYINFNGHKFKYGVISQENLLNDLRNWENMFMAGRLHKPVQFFGDYKKIIYDIEQNRYDALSVGALLSKPNISLNDLFKKIAYLSYAGDKRMSFAEDPEKVDQIVKNNLNAMFKIYGPIIKTRNDLNLTSENFVERDDSKEFYERIVCSLPINLSTKIDIKKGSSCSDIKKQVKNAIMEINSKTSTVEPIKAVLNNGFLNSWRYLDQKIKKSKI